MSYKIKKNGLIWKLHKEFNSEVYNKLLDDEPVGLCLFFWNTILQMFKGFVGVVATACAVLLILMMLAFLLNALVGLVTAAFGVFLPFISYEAAFVGVSVVLGGASFFLVVETFLHSIGSNAVATKVLPSYITKLLPQKEDGAYVEDVPESLIKSYWKAFKGKVCPLVQVEDE